MKYMGATSVEDIGGDNEDDDEDDEDDIVDHYLVRSNSDPGEKVRCFPTTHTLTLRLMYTRIISFQFPSGTILVLKGDTL